MLELANTEANLVYTTPSDSRAIIKSIQLANHGNLGSNTMVTLSANNLTSSFVFGVSEIFSNNSADILSNPLVLQENQTISVTANVANTISGVISLLEINRNEQ